VLFKSRRLGGLHSVPVNGRTDRPDLHAAALEDGVETLDSAFRPVLLAREKQ
jgi:hypothetical protein